MPYSPALSSRLQARGFTLIELVLVIILVGIMAIYAAPKFSSLGLFGGTGFRDQAISALQMGRKYAIAQRRNVRVRSLWQQPHVHH